jgi:hypothetical protein
VSGNPIKREKHKGSAILAIPILPKTIHQRNAANIGKQKIRK